MPDSEDNIYYKISKIMEEKFEKFEQKIVRLFERSDEEYKKLWQKTEEQEGRLKALEKFQEKYEPKVDRNTLITWAVSIIVPTLIAGIYIIIQTWGGRIG